MAISAAYHRIARRRGRGAVRESSAPDWLHSYVTQDKIYRVYIAPNEEMVREHARQGGFPANRVSEVKQVIDPTSAEA